ncbi:MAG: hypothetical protein N2651_10600 [Fimbriimonadales bacterium]|nr:hypothetical protein [Fimbriimonadales bacterium]
MKRALRYAPYLIVLLAVLGLLGWARFEQRRAERVLNESVSFSEPEWARHLPSIRAAVQRRPTDEAKLTLLTDQITAVYRELDVPLRFKLVKSEASTPMLRLNAAVILPRWYTARAARLAYDEARRALGREIPVHIYETYIVGRSRKIGVCREQDGVVEVALR